MKGQILVEGVALRPRHMSSFADKGTLLVLMIFLSEKCKKMDQEMTNFG